LQEPSRPKTGVSKSGYVSQKEYETTGNYSAIASNYLFEISNAETRKVRKMKRKCSQEQLTPPRRGR
jgi:hypothetical protein